MTLIVIRVFFILAAGGVGYYIGALLKSPPGNWGIIGAGFGILGAVFIILLELSSRRIGIRNLSAAVFGLLFGLFMAWLITGIFSLFPIAEEPTLLFRIILTLILCYLGMVIAVRGRDEFNLIIPYVKFARQDQRQEVVILDTSVIIDGRIADICQTKFIEGRFVIPRFILKELQQIADSQDPIKRNRGRRGLDILNKVRKTLEMDVIIHEEAFPDVPDVDAKLVKLAKLLNAKVFTNDYNLNKIAELQGVPVLNVNDLANALKPVVLPGELMEVKLIKEGKEHNQAVAYLDDGTMVVVEDGKRHIGHNLRVLVTSVLQTSAGRMIFAKMEGH